MRTSMMTPDEYRAQVAGSMTEGDFQVSPKQFSALFGHLSRANWLHPCGTDESGNTASRNATKLVRRYHRPERIPADWAEAARHRRRAERATS